jgi:hypothetical protein
MIHGRRFKLILRKDSHRTTISASTLRGITAAATIINWRSGRLEGFGRPTPGDGLWTACAHELSADNGTIESKSSHHLAVGYMTSTQAATKKDRA